MNHLQSPERMAYLSDKVPLLQSGERKKQSVRNI